MPKTHPPLGTALPPLICGTATFNHQYNADPFALPTNEIVETALSFGIRAFDTSPYYGPSEELLGCALNIEKVQANYPRSTYHLITKVGRIGASEFDYSSQWVRFSVQRSLQRLRTAYLDVVYCHDVEFVTANEVLCAVKELRLIRDLTGSIRYIGISGYPVALLCELAEMVLSETGEPLDAVMSYANFTVQNTRLAQVGLQRLLAAGVSAVPNASLLGMGLLRGAGVPVGGSGDFHPAPTELRARIIEAANFVKEQGDKLEVICLTWSLAEWAKRGSILGGVGGVGVSVIGVSNLEELKETVKIWESILEFQVSLTDFAQHAKERRVVQEKRVQDCVLGVRNILGEWLDYTWRSPGPSFVNKGQAKYIAENDSLKP